MIVVFSGLPGSGKSLRLARTCIGLLYRNKNYHQKYGRVRKLYTNLKFSDEVQEEFSEYIEYWTDLRQLIKLRDVDVVIDEIATYFDATQWANMSLEVKRWLQQHRKFGIEIYGTAQDFAQCDISFRRLTSDLQYLTKLFGSRDISATKPNPKHIWGLVAVRTLDPVAYDEQKSKFASNGLPSFMWISKESVSVFDTRAEVKSSAYPPLRHIERVCERADCTIHKTIHA